MIRSLPDRLSHSRFPGWLGSLGLGLATIPAPHLPAQPAAPSAHRELVRDGDYPPAAMCQSCHPLHYKEWSASPHAYAALSPVNNAMQAKIALLTNGTNGDFCMRCHSPVGLQMGEPVFLSGLDRNPTAREGITCIVCHRTEFSYGKVSGRLPVRPGDLYTPVFGPFDDQGLRQVIDGGEYEVVAERGKEGRAIHASARELPAITTPSFCGSCHDVNHVFGFRLEEAFSEYKAAPAARDGVTCQDCHMGKEPGTPSGYLQQPVAFVGGKPTRIRKRTNHMFAGPDYSIIHPGLFPHNPEAARIATPREWLQFDVEAGWGTDGFEDEMPEEREFPERWSSLADRYQARSVIDENLRLLEEATRQRRTLLQTGYRLGSVVVEESGEKGIRFKVEVRNGTDGHNVPTGFDAERLVYLQVAVTDARGRVLFESGDLDPNGDLRDRHSLFVRSGALPRDPYLFNLQSKFIVNMIRGGDREQVLAVNSSPDPLPFIRPSTRSTILLGRPAGSRKHRRSIPPLSSKWASYRVGRAALAGGQGPYRATIRLVAGMVPVNLIHEIQDVGFDYGMSPRQVAEAVVAGHQVLWEEEIDLGPGPR